MFSTPTGVACNHSEGVENRFSLRRKDGLHLKGLSEAEVISLLTEPEPLT